MPARLRLYFLGVFCTASFSVWGEDRAGAAARSFSIDSGYLPSLASNRAFWKFGIEFEGAGSAVFDGLGEHLGLGSNGLTRAGLAIGTYFLWPTVQEAYFVANHELGHGSRLVSVGLEPYYVWNSKGKEHSNIFSFFIEGLTTGGGAYTANRPGNYSVPEPSAWYLSIAAGGMNNSAMFAEALEDRIALQGGHIMEYIGYVRGKQDAADYVDSTAAGQDGGDVEKILDYYAERDRGITGSDIKNGSNISRWASATHWAYGVAAVRYVFGGDPAVRPLSLGAFKLPDVSHFIMNAGLSYKVRTALLAGEAQYPIELEYVYKGEKIIEASVGYRGLRQTAKSQVGMSGYQFYLNSTGAFGIKAQRDTALSESLNASFGASVYQANLLEGQRNIAKYLSSNLGYEVWGRLSKVF